MWNIHQDKCCHHGDGRKWFKLTGNNKARVVRLMRNQRMEPRRVQVGVMVGVGVLVEVMVGVLLTVCGVILTEGVRMASSA